MAAYRSDQPIYYAVTAPHAYLMKEADAIESLFRPKFVPINTLFQEHFRRIALNYVDLGAADRAVKAMFEGSQQLQRSVDKAIGTQSFVKQMYNSFNQIKQITKLKNIDVLSENSQHEAPVMDDASFVLVRILKDIKHQTEVFKINHTS